MALSTNQIETRKSQRAASERKRQERIAFNASTHGRTYFDSQSRPTPATEDEYTIARPAPVSREPKEKASSWNWETILTKAAALEGGPTARVMEECETRKTFDGLKAAQVPVLEFQALGLIPPSRGKNGRWKLIVKCWGYVPGVGEFHTKGSAEHTLKFSGEHAQASEMREMYRIARKRAEDIVRRKIATAVAAELKKVAIAAKAKEAAVARSSNKGEMVASGQIGWLVGAIVAAGVVVGLIHGIHFGL